MKNDKKERDRTVKIRQRLAAVILAAAAVLCLSSCGAGKVKTEQQTPGTIADGIYLSGDGAFTVRADAGLWETDAERSGGESALYLKDAENVWISFSQAGGITAEMIASFEEAFVNSYMEGIREYYPDAAEADSRVINDKLARLDMVMTSDDGAYKMYQILYLAADGENGYIITSTLPEDRAEELKPLVCGVAESIEFVGQENK